MRTPNLTIFTKDPTVFSTRVGRIIALLLVVVALASTGCRINNITSARRLARIASITSKSPVQVRRQHPQHSAFDFASRLIRSAEQPSERTLLLLRRYDLVETYEKNPREVIKWLRTLVHSNPQMNEVHALAEIAQLQADWALRSGNDPLATELYATAVFHSYQFLFDSKLNVQRNAYDPQFRSICDTYNNSLEGMLRIICKGDQLKPGATHWVGEGDLAFQFSVEVQGRWANQEFETFELVNDYRTVGLDNLYHTFGLGVPLIAVRKSQPPTSTAEEFYPPLLTFPMTAFLSVEERAGPGNRTAVLKLFDPLEKTTVDVNNRMVPLESDITTPLAYYLNDPLLNANLVATAGLLSPNFADKIFGLFMLEPYDPNKIPVVMVHGLWSSPITWLHMFNDLRANRDIRENYQFWFYSYPTGQPFWFSARQMREDLAEARKHLDIQGNAKALDEMILVGHSMGGLISRMQTIDSGDEFWKIVSDRDFSEVDGEKEIVGKLEKTFFFKPNPSIRRVVTLGTPHAGSKSATTAARWIGKKLISLPEMLLTNLESLTHDNPDVFNQSELLKVKTSLDSLAPASPFFDVLAKAKVGERTRYHNIVGRIPRKAFVNKVSFASEGDGIVELQSAKTVDAISEIEVPTEHMGIHQHPLSVLEVRRILIEHLVELDRVNENLTPVVPLEFHVKDTSSTPSNFQRFGSSRQSNESQPSSRR